MVSDESFSLKKEFEFDVQDIVFSFENHSAIMLFIEPITGEIVGANQAAVDFYGYSKSSLCSMRIQQISTLPSEEEESQRLKAAQYLQNFFISDHHLANGQARRVEVFSSLIIFRGKPILFSIIHDATTNETTAETLRKSEDQYQRLFDNAPLGIFQSTPDGKVISINPAFAHMFGYASTQDAATSIKNVSADLFTDPDRRSVLIRLMAENPNLRTFENVYRRKNGSVFVGNLHVMPIHDAAGNLMRIEGIIEDITERKLAHTLIQESEERLVAVMEGSQLGYSDWNIQTGVIRRNERWAGMLGYTLEEIESNLQQWENLIHPDDRARALQAIQDHLNGKTLVHRDEYRLRKKNGDFCWVLDQGKIIEYDLKGSPLRMTATHTDITERKQAEAELLRTRNELEIAHRDLQLSFERERQLARMDDMTGINNRRYLFELAVREFNIATRYTLDLSVIMFDVDDFKQINDIFGHAMGDQAIKYITKTVCAELRSADMIGRYGGDEFLILLPQTTAQEALPLAERIRLSVSSLRMETESGLLRLTISLGIAQTIHNHSQPDTLENLLLRADQALYCAKQAGKNCSRIFDSYFAKNH